MLIINLVQLLGGQLIDGHELNAAIYMIFIVSWILAIFVANSVANKIGGFNQRIYGSLIGSFVLSTAIVLFLKSDHPNWFAALSALSIVASTIVVSLPRRNKDY